jgi:hypothetical protein
MAEFVWRNGTSPRNSLPSQLLQQLRRRDLERFEPADAAPRRCVGRWRRLLLMVRQRNDRQAACWRDKEHALSRRHPIWDAELTLQF